jgi:hypothetical protein
MVGYFLPQACVSAVRLEAANGTAFRPPHAKYFECRECEASEDHTVEQLIQVDGLEILIF